MMCPRSKRARYSLVKAIHEVRTGVENINQYNELIKNRESQKGS